MLVMRKQKTSGSSPYNAKGKVPFRYSAEVYACQRACKDGKRGEYERASAAFWERHRQEFIAYRHGMGLSMAGLP